MLTLTLLTLASGPALADAPAEPAPVLAEVPDEVPAEASDEAVPTPPRAPNLWLSDQNVEATGLANDVFAMGQTVDLAGTVQDNAFAMGQTVQLGAEGQVDGDLVALAQLVRVDRPVSGDVYAVGEVLEIGPDGVIGGDLYAAGSEVVIRGSVLGDVEVMAGELDLHPGATVGGDLDYAATREAQIPAGVVAGGVSFEEIEEEAQPMAEHEPSLVAKAFWGALGLAWSYASSLLVGFVLIALAGQRLARAAGLVRSQPARSAGIGFVIAVVLPVAALVAMALILPLPLGVMGLGVWAVGLYVARLLVAWALGDALLEQLRPGAKGSPYMSLAVGLPALLLAFRIPWLGALLWLGVTVVGLGAIWSGALRAE